MTVREWKFEDLLKIEQLDKECFPADFWNYLQFSSLWERGTLLSVLSEDGDNLSGYAALSYVGDEGEIEKLAVAEEYRRCGLGSELFYEIIEKAKKAGVKTIFLEVRVTNREAMALYLKHGFVGVYAKKRYYSDGEDALVMKKEL